jgi:hypothetical protein
MGEVDFENIKISWAISKKLANESLENGGTP